MSRIVLRHTVALAMLNEKQGQKTTRKVSKYVSSFLQYQMIIDALKKLPQTDQAKQDMLTKCEDYYHGNKSELIKIEQFKTTYSSADAIRWFTYDSFVYRLLNRALRTEHLVHLYLFRFFIIDLCRQLEYERKLIPDRDILKLHRGQMLFTNEFDELKANIGQLVSTNSFMSTSRLEAVAMQFILGAVDTDEFKVVLFEIEDDCQDNRIIFADIDKYSQLQGEKEVLFCLGTVFRIGSIEFDSTFSLWRVKMIATDEISYAIEECLDSTIRTENRSSSITFANLLLEDDNHLDIAEQFLQMLLRSFPKDDDEIADFYQGLGLILCKTEDLFGALKVHLKAYKLRTKHRCRNRIDLNQSLNAIADVYTRMLKYDCAVKYYKKSLVICEKNHLGDHYITVTTLRNLGRVYMLKKQFDKTLDYLMRARETAQRIEHLPEVAFAVGDIALLYENELDYDAALSYYYEQYDINENILSLDQYFITEQYLFTNLMAIVYTYKKIGQLNMALLFCQHRLAQQKRTLAQNHSRIGFTLQMIGDIYYLCGKVDKVLEYYMQALLVFQNCSPPERFATIICMRFIGSLMLDKENYDADLTYWINALDLQKNVYSSDDLDLAYSYKSIGDVHGRMKNYQSAINYYAQALGTYRKMADRENVRQIQDDIIKLKKQMDNSKVNTDFLLPIVTEAILANETIQQRATSNRIFSSITSCVLS